MSYCTTIERKNLQKQKEILILKWDSDILEYIAAIYKEAGKGNRINRIDQAIYESEQEMFEGGETIELDEAFEILNKKYYG